MLIKAEVESDVPAVIGLLLRIEIWHWRLGPAAGTFPLAAAGASNYLPRPREWWYFTAKNKQEKKVRGLREQAINMVNSSHPAQSNETAT